MKNLITLSLIVFISTVTFAGNVTDTVKKQSFYSIVTEETFEYVFTNEIVKYIETRDTTTLSKIIDSGKLCFIAKGEYERKKDKDFFFNFLDRHLNIITKNALSVSSTEDTYVYYEFPDGKGGAFKFSVFYPNSDRYDDFIITYGGNAKMISMSLYTEVNKNPYYDGNIGKVVGGDYGFEGVEGQEYKD